MLSVGICSAESMADSLRIGENRKEIKRRMALGNTQPKKSLVASIPKHCSKALQRIVKVDQSILGTGTISEIGHFLLKLAVLEAVRRLSKSHCPFLWHSLQALQCICLTPLKWFQSWGFFRGLVKCMQGLSRPLFLLSVATSLSSLSANIEESSGSSDDSQARTDPQSDSLANRAASDSRPGSGVTQSQTSEDWMLQLVAELEREGIVLPERITEDDLRRFYHVAKGDFTSFLSSVKRTINWRQTFRFMSPKSLRTGQRWCFGMELMLSNTLA
ncbi:Interleukin-2 receptor subunit alpha [Bienertia sinuspersici]